MGNKRHKCFSSFNEAVAKGDDAIKPDVLHVQNDDGNLGARILAEAQRLDADLLIMGAYGHSRLHWYFSSDASSHVLKHAVLPVLLAG